MSSGTETKKNWKDEIKGIMRGFKFSKNEVDYVISSAKEEIKAKEKEKGKLSNDQKYFIAWRKFKTILDMPRRERNVRFA